MTTTTARMTTKTTTTMMTITSKIVSGGCIATPDELRLSHAPDPPPSKRGIHCTPGRLQVVPKRSCAFPSHPSNNGTILSMLQPHPTRPCVALSHPSPSRLTWSVLMGVVMSMIPVTAADDLTLGANNNALSIPPGPVPPRQFKLMPPPS